MSNEKTMSQYKITDIPLYLKVIGTVSAALLVWNTYTNTFSEQVDAISLQSAEGRAYVKNIDNSINTIREDLGKVEKATQINSQSIEGMKSDINNLQRDQSEINEDIRSMSSKIDAIYNYLLNSKDS